MVHMSGACNVDNYCAYAEQNGWTSLNSWPQSFCDATPTLGQFQHWLKTSRFCSAYAGVIWLRTWLCIGEI